jgi:uncharacterized membrane protein
MNYTGWRTKNRLAVSYSNVGVGLGLCRGIKRMQMQSTYWLEKVLIMICLYVNALLCTLQQIVIHAMQLSGVNSEN